jgi:hypothetical protein
MLDPGLARSAFVKDADGCPSLLSRLPVSVRRHVKAGLSPGDTGLPPGEGKWELVHRDADPASGGSLATVALKDAFKGQ